MAITAVIPVRAGSTRVKNKNIRPFAGSSLLEIKIEQLKRISGIDEIIVSSDSEEMLELATKLGVNAKRRPDEYCDEKTKSFNDVVEYIANDQVSTEVMMWTPVVCPLLNDDSLQNGMKVFEAVQKHEVNADSVVSVQLLKEYVFDQNGPANFSREHHVPSQKLPNWHIIQNGFFIANTQDMARWKYVYGPKPYLYEISKIEAIDIDEMIEFKMAEYIYMHKNEEYGGL